MRLGHLLLGATAPAAGGPLSGAYITAATSATDATSCTFSGVSIGTADATRRVVVGVAARNVTAPPVTSVTIGGVSATIDVSLESSGNTSVIARAAVPTGTTADIVVTFSATSLRCGIGVWTITGGAPAVNDTATATSFTSENLLVAGVADGFIIAHSSTVGAQSWANITEQYNEVVESTFRHSGAHVATSTSGDVGVQAGTPGAMTCVAYAPA